MMTREQLRKMVVEIVAIMAITLVCLVVGNIMSSDKAEARIRNQYSSAFYDILPANNYSEIDSNMVDNYSSIDHVYEAYDIDGDVIGYIVDITITNESGYQLHVIEGVDSSSRAITGIRRVGDEENPLLISDADISLICAQLSGKPIPVALNSQRDNAIIVGDTIQRLGGLNDGTYYAQRQFADRRGYIDYVEIDVADGIITRVLWDAFNTDPTTHNRRDASLSGAYTVSGEIWATQSYNLCHALMDLQDPARLAMKSDGTTEIVDGVTVNITAFVELANECIANSRAGYTKDDYYDGMDYVFMNLFSDTAENLGLVNSAGFVVYSFSDYPNLFNLYDANGEVERYLTIREYEDFYRTHSGEDVPTTDNISSDDYVVEGDVTPIPTPVFSDGTEDGIVIGYDSLVLTGNIDGLAMSSIRTFIDGSPTNVTGSEEIVTSVNMTYRFLREYLNWY